MKVMTRLFLIIICLSTIISSQIRKININEFINNNSFAKYKFQAPGIHPAKKNGNDFRKINFQVKKSNAVLTPIVIFKPVTITYDSVRETFTYNNFRNILTNKTEILRGGVWENSSRNTYTYDNSGTILSYLNEIWEDNGWKNVDKNTYVNDNSGNCLVEQYETWNDSANTWVNVDRYSYTYNNSGSIITQLNEEWSDSSAAWINSYRFTLKYDNNNNITERVSEEWENNTWNPYMRDLTTYNAAGNIIISDLERWYEGIWKVLMRMSYTYNDLEEPVTRLLQRIDEDGEIHNSAKDSLVYDSRGNTIMEIYEDWTGTEWFGSGRITFTYDDSNNRICELQEYREDSIWVKSDRYSYTFDASGNNLSKISEVWIDTTWMNNSKTLYTYDNNGNGIHGENYQWEDGLWVPCENDLELAYNNNQESIYIYTSKADVEYALLRLTDIEGKELQSNEYNLSQNYPNPFNPATVISYQLPANGHVQLKVYDILGKEVATLVNEVKAAGNYKVKFDAGNLTSGVYIYRLSATGEAGSFTQSRKLILMK